MKELVRSKIFTKVYHKSTLAWYMKTNLYKEWLETNHINKQLKNSSMSSLQFQVTPVEEKLDYIIRQLSRDTLMDYREPDTKIVKQGYRTTDVMYIIAQGTCKVSVYDISLKTGVMQDIQVGTLSQSDYFGEISLIFDSIRSATVSSDNYCTLGSVSLNTLFEICENQAFVRKALI